MAACDYDPGILGGGAAGRTATAGSAQFGARMEGVDRGLRVPGSFALLGVFALLPTIIDAVRKRRQVA